MISNIFDFKSRFSLSLLAIVCILFFPSCEEEPEPIDLGFDENQTIQTYFTDTATVVVKLFQLDSITTRATSSSGRSLVGQLQENEFVGTYSAESFLQLSTSGSVEDLVNDDDQEAIFDSLVLFLEVDYTYGDDKKEHQIAVRRLKERFSDDPYYQFDSLPKEEEILGIINYPATLDTNSVVRARLSDDFGQELFDYGLENEGYSGDSLFTNFAKGLSLQTLTSDASVLGVAPFSSRTRLRMYFHYPNDTTDTYDFDFSGSFFKVQNDLSGTPLAPLMIQEFLSTQDLGDFGVVQAGTGISAKLEFPYLQDFSQENGIIIQRAELRLPSLDAAMSSDFTAPSQLFFFFSDGNGFLYSANGALRGVEEQTGTPLATGVYTDAGQSYRDVGMSNLINELAREGNVQGSDGLILQPSANNSSINRFIFPTQGNPNNLSDIRLRIYYSVIE